MAVEQLESTLTELTSEMKGFSAKAQEEIKNLGAVQTETKTALDAIRAQMTDMQTQLDAVDAKTQQKHIGGVEHKTLGQMVTESQEYADRKSNDFVGRKTINIELASGAFPLTTKTDILESTIGTATTGVMPLQRLPGIVTMPQQALRIRDIMNTVPMTTGSSFDFVYQSTQTNVASPQVEGSAKSQSYYAWLSTSGAVRDIAHYINVSKQSLSDIPWLRGQIDSELTYGLKVKEEAEVLSGDGTGVHLNGIITQATSFDTSLLVAAAGYTYLDVLRYAKLQARLAGLATYAPSAFVISPTDMAKIELTKDDQGVYVVGDPKTGTAIPYVWGLPVVESDSITTGTFLVGAFNTAAYLVDRQAVSIEISFEHDTNFTKNLATVLCEERIGLAVTKATAFITGSFTSSPATT